MSVPGADPLEPSLPTVRQTADTAPDASAVSRHADLVDRASDVFFSKGYDGASIRDVADEVGLLKGSLYHYIDSKEDLLFAIVAEVHRRLRVLAERGEGDDVVAELRRIIVGHAEYVAANATKAGVCAREWQRLSPARQAEVHDDRLGYEQAFVALLDRGQRLGVFRTDISARIGAKGVLGMLHLLPQWYDQGGRLTAAEVGEQLARLVLDGLVVGDVDDATAG